MSRTSRQEPEYSIAAVSKLTGTSCHALRVWERRYGFPVPHRSASGHRRYGREQVRALKEIADLAQKGRPIGELIAAFLSGRHEPADLEPDGAKAEGVDASARIVDCLIAGDLEAGAAAYREATEGLDPVEIVSRIIGPAWIDVGERWFRKEAEVFQERIASEFLGRKIRVLIDAAARADVCPMRTIVIGTVQGDRHEGGILMLSLLLEWDGWRVINLGVDLPVREFLGAVKQWKPDALALSFVLSRNIKKRFQELVKIQGLPIFAGGRSILNYQGLARRHGLIPLTGPITQAVAQMRVEFEGWVESHAQGSAP
jgi:methanogenic corrinoid protein MtbC1